MVKVTARIEKNKKSTVHFVKQARRLFIFAVKFAQINLKILLQKCAQRGIMIEKFRREKL